MEATEWEAGGMHNDIVVFGFVKNKKNNTARNNKKREMLSFWRGQLEQYE